MYGSWAEMRAFAVAESVWYFFGFCVDCTLKNAAFAVPLQCTSGTNPWSASSFSRRSVIGVSLGHFIATSPSSVLKECTGSPSTSPPLSTPRIVAHQPYVANALVMRTPSAQAAFPHRYLLWSPVTCSSYWKASIGTDVLP